MIIVILMIVTVQEYLVLDRSSMQTVAADGQHTSFHATAGSFDRFISIDECNAVVGWMHGETKLYVSNDCCCTCAIELLRCLTHIVITGMHIV